MVTRAGWATTSTTYYAATTTTFHLPYPLARSFIRAPANLKGERKRKKEKQTLDGWGGSRHRHRHRRRRSCNQKEVLSIGFFMYVCVYVLLVYTTTILLLLFLPFTWKYISWEGIREVKSMDFLRVFLEMYSKRRRKEKEKMKVIEWTKHSIEKQPWQGVKGCKATRPICSGKNKNADLLVWFFFR